MKKLLTVLGIKDKAGFWAFVAQFIKYGIVGLSNTGVNLLVYYVLVLIGVHYLVATIMAFVISVLNAFFWNRNFVFKVRKKNIPKQLAKVYAAYGFTFLLGLGTLFLMVDVLGISKFIAPLLNLCFTVPTNFLINKFWTFK